MNAPSNLTATPVSESQINLAWKDNSSREAGFQVFQSDNNTLFNKVGMVPRNTTRYDVIGLTPATNYYFKVQAYRSGAASPFSNTVKAATLGTVTPPPSGDGIASRYPGDQGIGNDPDVILADDFESYSSPSELTAKWSQVGMQANLRIATEPGNFYSGGKALEMKLPVSATEIVNSLGKKLSPAQDVLFIRAYTKFDPDYNVSGGSNHNGLRISAGNIITGQPAPPGGTGFFLASVQNNIQGSGRPGEVNPGYFHVYAYWPKQRQEYGDHWYSDGWVSPGGNGLWVLNPVQYPDFVKLPNVQPPLGEWFCYELMVKANTIGKNDGEVAWWYNGKLTGRIPNLFLRSIDSLKIDFTALRHHAVNNTIRINKKWYDNVVIAKSYIGPMKT